MTSQAPQNSQTLRGWGWGLGLGKGRKTIRRKMGRANVS